MKKTVEAITPAFIFGRLKNIKDKVFQQDVLIILYENYR